MTIEYIINDIPLDVSREIVAIEYPYQNNNEITGVITLPDIYYVYMKNDINVYKNTTYYFATTPSNARLFSIKHKKGIISKNHDHSQSFPEELFGNKYHWDLPDYVIFRGWIITDFDTNLEPAQETYQGYMSGWAMFLMIAW